MSGARILHVLDKIGTAGSRIHGPSRLLLALWPELERKGIELELCILRDRTEAVSEFVSAGVQIRILGRGKLDPRTLLDLVGLIRKGGWNAVHLHGYGATTFGRLAAWYCGVPSVVHEHMVDENVPVYQKIADRVLSHLCDAGIAVSESVKLFMVDGRFLARHVVDVIPNTVAIRYEDRPSADYVVGVKEKLGLPRNCRLIGAIGRLHPVKGLNYLIESFPKILKSIPDVHLVLVGEGDERQQLKAQVDSADLGPKVHFAGHQDDIKPFLAALDVLILSSLSEGCPLSLLEGMAFGIPVVATRVGGIPAVLTDEQTGLLIEPCNSNSIADGVIRCLSDPALAESLSVGARNAFRKRFAPEVVAEQYISVYDRVLGQSLVDQSGS